ncbi:phospholipase [Salinigranum rubrum]|uniref:Phospholipase n=1 Tax=Salinigranum rubrum TaxID=755307 RepID=A0A2I8VGD0_9EURY|nr:cutinase family protein [Salinigranum rubrum]AUV80970.1 phospholipase [Salinigranum rubrum]
MNTTASPDGPHQGQPIRYAGAPLRVADAAVVLLHGRGATARSILDLADACYVHGVAYAAPQAQYNRWYPGSFLAPRDSNEPELSSALAAVDAAVSDVTSSVPPERVVVGGFSQGACLAAEYVARNPRRYGGLVVLSGGLVGPEGTDFEYGGDLAGTPVFLGCSDVDPYVPLERVHASRDAFESLGGDVTERIYEGMAHTTTDDELAFVTDLLADLVREAGAETDERGGDGR